MLHFNPRGFLFSLLWTLLLSAVLTVVVPAGEARFPDEPSLVVTDRGGRLLRVYLNSREQWCMPLDGSAPVPEKLLRAVLLYEDRAFFRHFGVDPLGILRAAYLNLREGRRVSGGSTITMQVARLMRPAKRTLVNKLREILQAVRLEILYSKETILRFYLDHAPYGGNIVGAEAASRRYFGKPADCLTWAEAALLAVLPNAPSLLLSETGWARLRDKRNELLGRLRAAGRLSAEILRLAEAEPLPTSEKPFPSFAPHLAERIRSRFADASTVPSAPVRTALDLELQRRVEEIVALHSESLSRLGIHNAAAVVVDNQEAEVRVYVGSQDFTDSGHGGQVDGVNAIRSTGSLLKPFLYALAIDDGDFLPSTLIKDVPTQFGSFSPKNPDQRYAGLVSVREALIRSLNVPAARALQEYGLQRFYRFLKSAGVSSLFRTSQDYGLPLILGGAEVSLLELAMLYRGLASGGSFRPLVLIPTDRPGPAFPPERSPEEGSRLLSPGASSLVLDVLRDLRRPGVEYYWESYAGSPPLAWKTGTSYGQKDGWAMGVNPRWTIGVWVGNFSGEGNANLKSSRCAGPLLFDILRVLPRGDEEWFSPPRDALVPVKLCRDTGYRAGGSCPDPVVAMAPAHAHPLPICSYHRTITVTNDEAYRVDSLCWEPGDHKRVSVLVYPPDVAQFLRERGQQGDRLPPLKPGCGGGTADGGLTILYPEELALLWIPRDLDGEYQKITLRAAHTDGEAAIYWYVDDVYRGRTRRTHSRAVLLSGGWHTLLLIDESGRRAERRFFVDVREGTDSGKNSATRGPEADRWASE